MKDRTRRLMALATIVRRRFREDRCLQIASSLSFTSLLALVPIVTVVLTVIAAFPRFAAATVALETFILEHLVPASADVIWAYTREFTSNAAKLTAVGIGFLALTSLLLLLTIDRAFNYIFRVRTPRPLVQRVAVYCTLIVVGPVLVGASLTLTSWLVGHAVGLVRGLPGAGVVVLTVAPVVLTAAALALLYAAMPNRAVDLRDAALGGCIAGIAFEITKRVFAYYVSSVPTYTLLYGAFATLPIFLIWIYVSWLVVISGAVLVAALPEWRRAAARVEPAVPERERVTKTETETEVLNG